MVCRYLYTNSMYCSDHWYGAHISEQKCFLFTKMIFDQPSKITFRNFTNGKFCQAKPQLSSEPDAPLLQVTLDNPYNMRKCLFSSFSPQDSDKADLDCSLIDPLPPPYIIITNTSKLHHLTSAVLLKSCPVLSKLSDLNQPFTIHCSFDCWVASCAAALQENKMDFVKDLESTEEQLGI